MHTFPRSLKVLLLMVSLVTIFGLSACGTATQATPVQTATLVPTFTPIPLTATPTPTSTLTPTLTTTPTSTPTITPSPTPPGFVSADNLGFSLVYPARWDLTDQSSSGLTFTDSFGGLILSISSQAEKEATPFADLVQQMITSDPTSKYTILEKDTAVQIGSGILGHQALMQINTAKGQQFYFRLTSFHQGQRTYLIMLFTTSKDISSYKTILDKVYSSIRLFRPQPFGLPRGQTLVQVGGDPDAKYLDPALSSSSADDYSGLLYSGLVKLSPDLKIVPGLAEKWTTSPDGTVYTFTLWANLKFANGDPLTASYVQKSWERACDPKLKSTTARTYLGDIAGVKEKLDGKAITISGLKVIDERTLQVTLDGPKPYFLAKLTYPTGNVIDVDDPVKNPTDWMFSPNATGPYKVKSYTKGEAFIFERNLNYPIPANIQNVVFLMEPGGTPLSLYEEGTIDLTWLGSEDLKRISEPADPLNKELQTVPSMCTDMLILNTNKAPLDDIHVRQALALAIDKNQYNEKMANGMALITNNVLPPAMPGYQEREATVFDPAAAKAALVASKYGANLPTITIGTAGYGGSAPAGITLLVDMWQKNLGIKVKVEYLDPLDSTAAARNSTTSHLFMYGWCADYPDPENFVDLLFHSGNDFNIGKFNNAGFDALVEKARTEQNPSDRLQLYYQAETILVDNVAAIPLFNVVSGILVKPYIQGTVISPIGAETLSGLKIDETAVNKP